MAGRDKKALHFARVKIAGGPEIGESQMLAFEWKSFVNGGYIIRCKVSDPNLSLLRDKVIKQYLQKAREAPTEVEFTIGYVGGDETEARKAYITDLDLYGDSPHGGFEFVAIDPPNWFLNGGLGDGKVYKGRISDVIEKCVKEYAPGVEVEVTQTDDDENGYWAMMRQDPKTFIQSLLDWSADLTPKKTNWMVASVDEKIIIKEQFDFLQNRRHFGNYNNSMGLDKTNDIVDYAVLNNSFVSVIQNALVTQGISAVSGKFLDAQTSKDKTEIRDENTENKANTRTDATKAFKKPNCKWATSIMAVPELAGGEIGLKYEEWIGGRPRNLFISMLPMVMRVRLTIHGDPEYHDSSKLGVSTLNINWKDFDKQDFFLAGRWLVYGFHHRMTKIKKPRWFTDVYVYRIDHDADSKKA